MLQIPGHGHGMKISRDVNWGLRITLYLSNIDCLVYVFSVCQQELFCPILTTSSTNNRCHGQVPGPLTFYLLIFGAYDMHFVLLAYDLNPPSLHRQSLAILLPVYLWLGSSWEELFTRNRKTEIFHNNKLRTLKQAPVPIVKLKGWFEIYLGSFSLYIDTHQQHPNYIILCPRSWPQCVSIKPKNDSSKPLSLSLSVSVRLKCQN